MVDTDFRFETSLKNMDWYISGKRKNAANAEQPEGTDIWSDGLSYGLRCERASSPIDKDESEVDIKKPLIRQAGSAVAFLDSTATGREHSVVYKDRIGWFKKKIEYTVEFLASSETLIG